MSILALYMLLYVAGKGRPAAKVACGGTLLQPCIGLLLNGYVRSVDAVQ